MFKIFSNFIPMSDFCVPLVGHTNFGLGDPYITEKPISLFNDYIPTDYQMSYNETNILMLSEPNQLFGLHTWGMENATNFSCVITWNDDILNKYDHAIFLPFGISWLRNEFIDEMETRKKIFEVSFLCGAKKMIDGHKLRHRLYDRRDEITIPKKWYYTLSDYSFNNGNHTVTNMHEKEIIWRDSMFSVCIENSSNRNYHTEKIIDAFLSKTIPIYWGCPNLEELGYDPNGYIMCKDEDEFINVINNLTEDDYYSRINAIEHNKKKALYYANYFGRLKSIILDIIELNEMDNDKYASQEMEDKWIDEHLVLPENGFFLDIGACYPVIISNTYFFEKYKKWNGIAIEPDPTYFNELQKRRNCFLYQNAISDVKGKVWFKPMVGITETKESDSIEISTVRIDELLEKHNVKQIDLISIDIEGYEKQAWSTFDYKKYNPKIIIVEHTEFGKFDRSFADFILQDNNYYIAHTTPLNFIIVRKDIEYK